MKSNASAGLGTSDRISAVGVEERPRFVTNGWKRESVLVSLFWFLRVQITTFLVSLSLIG